ncbi:MAG: carboxypeptidase-like regulatory domain-containing protein, partial [Vicinamibacterales bacterium]
PGAAITTGVSPYNVTHPPSGTDGRYLATGLAPEVTLLTAALTHPQGVSFTLKATASVTPAAGRSTVVDLTVPPTGFVMGTVTTAFGAVSTNTAVRLYGIDPANSFAFLQAVTDSGGVYRFTDVPPGTFTVRVTDPLTSVLTNVPAVVVADQTTTVDVSTLAIATLDLTVVYTNGQPAVNAFVEIQKSSVDQYFRTAGVTGADGHLLITNVPGGAFVLRAHRPGAFSSATIDVPGTVTTHGAVIPITAVVPPLGTVLVRVTSPAGDPVAGARIDDVTGFAQSRGTTDANGELLLTNVIGGKAFKLRAYQPPSFSDYRETVGQLTGEGQVLTLPIVLGTTGSVGGHVTFVGGAPAGSVTVQVFTDVPRRNFVATTDASGAFQITGVALGAFRVTGRSIGNNSAGSFLGRIDTHGQTVTVDMTLADVILPATLRDANGHDYRVIADGRLTGSLGSTDGYESAFRLTFGPSGTIDNGFGGDNLASLELSARQLVIRDFEQGGAATPRVTGGIALTRKVFVPESGYFARYLEIFENTTTAPVTIDVQLRNELNSTRLVSTSSGDSVFTTADQWLVADAPAFPNAPAVAHVFEGSGATVGVGEVQPNASFLVQPVERWNTVVVPAGGRAILMHFTAQESNAAGAQAAAERLVQLPPEAVAGLTPPERQAIVNFVVPADGSSAVAPLVTVTGIVRVADGLPPVAGALVTVTGSRAPLFKPAIVVSTDAEGRYRASTLGVGPFTVQARDPISGALTPVASGVIGAGDVTVTQDLSFSTVGTLTGTVRFPDGSLATGDVHGTWVSSGVVSVSGGSPALSLQVPIAANGTFTVAAIPTGTYTLQWMAQSTVPFVQPRVATVPGVVVSSGQTTIAEIRLMAVATVRLTARRSDGSPLFNTWANIRRNDGLGFQGAGRTDSEEGVLFINNVPEGPFTIQMLGNDFVSVIGAVDGVVAPADDSQVVNVLFELLVRSVHGRVFARDGSTPVPNAYVELHGQADNSWIGWASTGADGSYRFEDVTVPSGGDSFRVIAYSPNFDVTVEGLGTFGAVTPAIDLTLPIAIVRGTVRYADGAPASQATVSIAQEDTSGNVQGAGVSTGSDGAFTTTANSGPFELWVRDERGTLQTLVGGDVPPASALETVDVVLPPSGRVSGSVRKADDQAIQSPSVAVSSSDAGSAVQWTDVSPFTFLRVPQGRFSLQGCDRDPVTDAGGVSSPQFVCGTANGAIAGDGAIATVDFTVAGTGSVTVTAVDADGVTPMPDVLVQIFAGTDGPLGVNAPYGPTDAAGVYSVAHVPEGLVTAVLYEPDTYRPLGFQWGTLTAPGVLNLTIARGTAMECATSLTGTNGLTWYVGCSGELVQGGDGLDPSPYQRASGIRINGVANTSAVALRLEPNARQVIAGPFQIAGVRVERKVFVPASGSFVRHLDTITNPSASPVTVDVDIEDILGGAVRVLTEPAATGNTYAVTLADPVLSPSSVYTRPALGLVFAGPEASVVAGPIRLPYLFGQASYRWTVTIPAGGSVTLMHFVVQRDAMTPMAADAQARALANLTDSSALAEMTSAEKARVVNFKIP